MILVRCLCFTIRNFIFAILFGDFCFHQNVSWFYFSWHSLQCMFGAVSFRYLNVHVIFNSKYGQTGYIQFKSSQYPNKGVKFTIVINFRIAFQLLLPFIGKSLPNHSQIRSKHLSSAFPKAGFSMSSQITFMPYQINFH